MTVRCARGPVDDWISRRLAPGVEWLCRRSQAWDNIQWSYVILAVGITSMVAGDIAFYYVDPGSSRFVDLAASGFWILWWAYRLHQLAHLHGVLERMLLACPTEQDAERIRQWISGRWAYPTWGLGGAIMDIAVRHWPGLMVNGGFLVTGIALYWATTFVGPSRPAKDVGLQPLGAKA